MQQDGVRNKKATQRTTKAIESTNNRQRTVGGCRRTYISSNDDDDVLSLAELVRLDHRAHRTVEDQDALRCDGVQVFKDIRLTTDVRLGGRRQGRCAATATAATAASCCCSTFHGF